jgi:hypothetical protein
VKLIPIDAMVSIEWMVISRVLRWNKWSRTYSGMGLWGIEIDGNGIRDRGKVDTRKVQEV